MKNYTFFKGNIVDAQVDAIVLPANPELKEGRGTSEAIFEAAGRRQLTKACNKIGHCDLGFSVPTLGYNLNAKYIIHTVAPRWIDGEHNEYDLLATAYASAIELAEVMECSSIAFPLLSAGNNGYEIKLAVEIAIKSIEQYACKCLQSIMIVLHDQQAIEMVEKKGHEVSLLVRNLDKDIEALEKKKKRDEVLQKAKEVAAEQLKAGLEWIAVKENRDKLISFGQMVWKIVQTIK